MRVTAEQVKHFPNGAWGRWIRFGLSVLVIPVLLFVLQIDRRVVRIEANRFTSVDAKAVYDMLGLKADKRDVPPPEVREALARIEADLRVVRDIMQRHIEKHP